MTTKKTKTNFQHVLVITIVSTVLIFSASCSKDKGGSGPVRQTGNTYSGSIKITRDSGVISDNMDFTFAEQPVNSGSFFRKGDGAVGLFTHTTNNNIYSLSGSMKDNPSSVFTGTAEIANGELILDLNGTDGYGPYTSTGTLTLVECINIEGSFFTVESVTYTITTQGQSDTQSKIGKGTVFFDQTKCQVTYGVPGINVTRTGDINGNKLILTGPFVLPDEQLTLSENTFKAEVTIIDGNHFEYTGTGKAKGKVSGISFTITGTSSGKFDKQ